MQIFLSHSSRDAEFITSAKENLLLPDFFKVLYYPTSNKEHESNMEEILAKLSEVDIFVIFISDNALRSKYVTQELAVAIRYAEEGTLREICPIIIDSTISPQSDDRIPIYIKKNLYLAESPAVAVSILKRILDKYY